MLSVYHGNRIEQLAANMATLLRQPQSCGLLYSDIVAVENGGMARWLSLQLAEHNGVAANIEYRLPAAFIWRLLRLLLPDLPLQSLYEPQLLCWRLLQKLQQEQQLPRELAAAVRARGGTGLYELAAGLAACYDQYILFRPDWIRSWQKENGGADHWQAQLWRQLAQQDGSPHWLTACDRLKELPGFVDGSGSATAANLPPRLFLFGTGTLSPAYLEVLQLFSRHSEIHMFVLNPCQEYWGDIVSIKQQSKLQVQDSARQHYSETGHRLLASMGSQGREFVDSVLEMSDQSHDVYTEPDTDTMLHRLQDNILRLQEQSYSDRPADNSIQVHICHSARREVEVLHDQLLQMFAELPQLRPSDIAVMAPDIESYAPYIEAVFDTAHHKLPYSIADRSSGNNQEAELILQLLQLGGDRFIASDWLQILYIPACASRFGVSEQQLPELADCLLQAGIRWGIDQYHRQQYGVAATEENTWRHGIDRLLLGYAVGSDMQEYDGLPAASIGSEQGELVGVICSLLQRLESWRDKLRQPRPLQQWSAVLASLRDDFLDSNLMDPVQQRLISTAIDNLDYEADSTAIDCDIPVSEIRACMRQRLLASGSSHGFMGRGITFCRMVPLRSIPFRVVCLMGMSFDSYPRRQHSPDFDLMRDQHRPGDRSRRNDDRYLFLEAIGAARDVLYFSYAGRSAYDNSELPPSVLLSELLDTIKQQESSAADIQTIHRLQAFHPEYFSSNEKYFSYDQHAARLARINSVEHEPPPPFLSGELPDMPPPRPELIPLTTLQTFFRNPQRYYLRHTLNIKEPFAEQELPQTENFALDYLQQMQLKRQLLHVLGTGGDVTALARRTRSDGLLPHAGVGEVIWQRWHTEMQNFLHSIDAAAIQTWLEGDCDTSINTIDKSLHGVLPVGPIMHIHPQQPSEREMIQCWLQHLLACAAGHSEGRCYFLQKDGTPCSWHWEVPQHADEILHGLLELYLHGRVRPLHYSPRLSYKWYKAQASQDGDPEGVVSKVCDLWHGNAQFRGECADFSLALLWRGQSPAQIFASEEFQQQSQLVCQPMLQHNSQKAIS